MITKGHNKLIRVLFYIIMVIVGTLFITSGAFIVLFPSYPVVWWPVSMIVAGISYLIVYLIAKKYDYDGVNDYVNMATIIRKL